MIPPTSTLVETDNLEGDEVEFGISDPRWVMRALTKLYSDTALACVREYSTNARDAMIDAGKADEPIEVFLPTPLNPEFVVKDTGIGMSYQFLRERFTQFSDSSKRDDANTNGMFGFGSKSAMAYTTTFQVIAVHDGMKTEAIVTRKPNFAITLKTVATSQTNECNGVTIKIPVHNPVEFAARAHNFYRFWPTGTVKVDGEFPEWTVGTEIDDDLYYSTVQGTSYVVMGSVPYRIANPAALFTDAKMSAIDFVVYVPNGSVEFTPSREDLEYTDMTKATLQSVISNFESKMLAAAKKEIETASSHLEAWNIWHKWTDILGTPLFESVLYDGEPLAHKVDFFGTRYKRSGGRGNTNEYYYERQRADDGKMFVKPGKVNVLSLNRSLIVTEFKEGYTTPEVASSGQKAMAHRWADEFLSESPEYVYFTDAPTDDLSPFLDRARIISFEKLKETAPRAENGGRGIGARPKGSWDYYTKDAKIEAMPLPTTGDVYYISLQTAKRYSVHHIMDKLNLDVNVIIVPANRSAKFSRENPKVKSFVEFAKTLVDLDGKKHITPDMREWLSLNRNMKNLLGHLKAEKIDDPRFKEIQKTIDKGANVMLPYNKAFDEVKAVGLGSQWISHDVKESQVNYFDEYPMVQFVSFGWYHERGQNKVVYQYMNETFANRQDKK